MSTVRGSNNNCFHFTNDRLLKWVLEMSNYVPRNAMVLGMEVEVFYWERLT